LAQLWVKGGERKHHPILPPCYRVCIFFLGPCDNGEGWLPNWIGPIMKSSKMGFLKSSKITIPGWAKVQGFQGTQSFEALKARQFWSACGKCRRWPLIKRQDDLQQASRIGIL